MTMLSMLRILLRHRRGTVCTMATDRMAVLVAGCAIERIVARLGAAEGTSSLLEFGHGHGWEGAGGVVLGLVVVDLVDGLGRVDNVALDSLLLDDRLDVLVDVVVHMLASERGSLAVGVPGIGTSALEVTGWAECVDWECILDLADLPGVLELRALLLEALLSVVGAAVLDGTVLYRRHLVGVLLREHLTVLDGLDGGVVVL